MRESVLFGLMVLGVVVGLAVLVGGEAAHVDSMVYGGGVIVLASVAVMTVAIARM